MNWNSKKKISIIFFFRNFLLNFFGHKSTQKVILEKNLKKKIIFFAVQRASIPSPCEFLVKIKHRFQKYIKFSWKQAHVVTKKEYALYVFCILKRSFQYETPCTYLNDINTTNEQINMNRDIVDPTSLILIDVWNHELINVSDVKNDSHGL